jgi:hypothetical protein
VPPDRRLLSIRSLVLALVVLTGAQPSAAQEPEPATRAEALRQQRLKKQQALVPNSIDRLQRALNRIEDPPIFLVARDGFYPKIGKLTTGSGPTLGVGYRNRTVLERYGILDGWIAGSIETYWGIEGRITFPELARGRVLAEGVATLREYPREAYFGLGPDSQRSDRSAFLLKSSRVGGRAGVRLAPFVLVGAGLTTINPRVGGGKEDGVPTTEDLFTPETAPGIDADVNYVVSTGFVEVDYSRPLNARRGGSYRVDFSRFNDRRDGNWSFTRTDIDLRQYVSFLADRRVLALRGWYSTTTADEGGSGIPFYLMPSLGGSDTLRGFRSHRFRGPHAILLQAEYRWELWSGLDAALFYDGGKVGLERSDLDFTDLESDYGVGFRFNTSNSIILRVDAAFGSRDGKHLYISLGGVF